MKVKDVRVLEEAYQDLDAGYQFYEQRERGVGEYFVASLIADIRSLRLYAGDPFDLPWLLQDARN